MKIKNLVGLGAMGISLGLSTITNAQNGGIGNSTIDGRERINSITTAVPFLLIGPEARAGAMGDAGVASTPDIVSQHWNSSKYAFVDGKSALSLSYTPWLQNLVGDINLAYLSGYLRLDDRQVLGASLRYFSLGNIIFTNDAGIETGQFSPNEFALDFSYNRRLTDYFSVGFTPRFIYSNLAAGQQTNGQDIKPGSTVAVDLSAFYQRDIEIGNQKAVFAFGGNISNIGAKISYTDAAERDFIPTNLRIGPSLKLKLDDYNEVSFNLDINKLLVPTNPTYITDSATGIQTIDKGRDPNRGVSSGIFGSFSDAPLGAAEELREINYAGGVEYWYDQQFALRGGYFYEDRTKGNRQYFTVGAGLKYQVFNLDFSYLIPTQQQNPLANTLRFSLSFKFNDAAKASNTAE